MHPHLLHLRIIQRAMDKEFLIASMDVAHPPTEGWKRISTEELNDLNVEVVYYKRGSLPLAVMLMDNPFVRQNDLKMAEYVQTLYRERMNGREVRVLMIYEELLARPLRIPKNVTIISVYNGDGQGQLPFIANN